MRAAATCCGAGAGGTRPAWPPGRCTRRSCRAAWACPRWCATGSRRQTSCPASRPRSSRRPSRPKRSPCDQVLNPHTRNPPLTRREGRRMRTGRTSAVVALGCLAIGGRAHGHGVVGQRSFIEPFIAEDANPKNEFVIGRPEWDHGREGRELSVRFGLEKKISDRFSLTIDSEWVALYPDEPGEENRSGFGNLGITLKYAFLVNADHEAIVSAAFESTTPTGSGKVGAGADPAFKPFLLYGKGA